jgi:hypothetical protein
MAAASAVNAAARVFLWAIGWLTYNRSMRRAAFAVVAVVVGCAFHNGLAPGDGPFVPDGPPDIAVDGPPDGPPIPILFVQSNQLDTGTATVSVAYPMAQTAGDFNVVVVSWYTPSATASVPVDTARNTYQLARAIFNGTITQQIYYATSIAAAGSGSNTVTVNWSAPSTYSELRILEYSGIVASEPVDATAAGSGNGTAMDSGSATTTQAHDLLVAAATANASSAGSGFTLRISTIGDIVEDQEVHATGTYNATATTGSIEWVMALVAFKGAN